MTTWTEVPAGKLQAAERNFWSALGERAEIVARLMSASSDFAAQVAEKAMGEFSRFLLSSNAEWKRASEIMADNFFSVEHAMRYFVFNPSVADFDALQHIPWPEEVLKECCNSHALVAMLPISLKKVHRRHHISLPTNRSRVIKFDEDECKAGWHLVRVGPLPESGIKTFEEQRALLPVEDGVPDALTMAYAMIGMREKNRAPWFPRNIYFRCLRKAAYHPHLIQYPDGRVGVYPYTAQQKAPNICIAVERKPIAA